jgi:hypothetical protein
LAKTDFCEKSVFASEKFALKNSVSLIRRIVHLVEGGLEIFPTLFQQSNLFETATELLKEFSQEVKH